MQVAPPPTAGPRLDDSVDETAVVTFVALKDDPLPFGPRTNSRPAPPAQAPLDDAGSMVGETSFMPALSDEDLGDAMPFPKKSD